MADSTIRLEDLSVFFRHRDGSLIKALDGVDLEVPPGEFVAIVGRSGHGKSTLLRIVAGLEKPTSGAVFLGDDKVAGPGSQRAMVFQQDTVFPWMHVKDNVEFGLKARGVGKGERGSIAQKVLEAVGLSGFENSWPKELSGGMRKRVAFAAVLATGSQVWLMDEPFASLDYFTRRSLHDQVLELWEDEKKTVLFVTHDIEEALILSDRVILISEGKILDDMTVDLPRPRTEEVRATAPAITLTKTILSHLGVTQDELV